jgi:acetolactate synthase I/II/III large subunit
MSCLSRFNKLTGGQVIYKKLMEHKVKNVFLYTGGAIMPVIDTFYDGPINYYINTHEQFAGHAATAYAKSTGNLKPGISICTSGPGLTNSITALTDATNDSTPLILFSGNVPLDAIGTNAFQECPATELTKPITKWSYMVKSTEELPQVVDEAFRISLDKKPGAVHIDLPKCITSAIYNYNLQNKSQNKSQSQSQNQGQGQPKHFFLPKQHKEFYHRPQKLDILTEEEAIKISKLIWHAKYPVILAGQGANNYSEEIRNFAKKNNVPITTTIHALGIFDETNPLALEFLGMHGSTTANYAIQNADLIIAIGTRFDDRITGALEKFAPEAFKAFKAGRGGIIHVNKNEDEIRTIVKSHYNFNMDAGYFLKKMRHVIIPRKAWFDKISKWKETYPFQYTQHPHNLLKTQQVMEAFNRHFLKYKTKDYIITTGVGNHQMMAAQFIKWKYPSSFITSGSLGVMGTGLPYAIGCQIANPRKLIIDIDGDGSFNQSLSELKTLINYNLPIKIALINDRCFSMVRSWEELFYKEHYTATNLKENADYLHLAESYGIKALRCSNIKHLDYTIAEFLAHPGPILCDFRVEADLCLPLVPPGAGLHEMIKPGDPINTLTGIAPN